MSTGLRHNGTVLRVDPATPNVINIDRQGVGPHEEVILTKHDPWWDIRFIAANRQLGVDERTRQLVTRPARDIDGWGGQWVISPDRKTATCDQWTLAIEGGAVAPGPGGPIHLEQRGSDFVDAAGARCVFAGCDMFLAYRQYLDGGAAALVPFVEESQTLGFTVWRIWSQGSKKQNTVLDLSPREAGYYDHVKSFAETLNANGLIPLVTGFVDNQDVQSPVSHWTELGARLSGTATLMSGFNQWSKNKSTFDPWALPSPGPGLIWSRGSDVDDTMTHARGAPASELHATRQSVERALMDATASPPTMRKDGGGGLIWMTEGNPFGDARGYTVHEAWKLGRAYSIEWGLAVFHNRFSQFGRLMDEATAERGAAWVQGMTL